MIRTRVGYSGGSTPHPTYRKMGDHTETLEIDFDPSVLTYKELVDFFWKNHNPNRAAYKGRQYLSLILFHNQQQKEEIGQVKNIIEERTKQQIQTEISPYRDFTLAEDYHQKYYLKRYPNAVEKLKTLYTTNEEFINSTLVARLNGFVKGYGSLTNIKDELNKWEIDDSLKLRMVDIIKSIKW